MINIYLKLLNSETLTSKASAILMTEFKDGLEKATSILPIKFSDKPDLSASSCWDKFCLLRIFLILTPKFL